MRCGVSGRRRITGRESLLHSFVQVTFSLHVFPGLLMSPLPMLFRVIHASLPLHNALQTQRAASGKVPASMATRRSFGTSDNHRRSGSNKVRGGTAMARRYSKSASKDVSSAMRRRKRGTLKSGGSGKTVKSRKQAIAIGLSEARKKGKKVPKKRSSRR